MRVPPVLKSCLLAEGMRWKNQRHVLWTPHRDRLVVLALRERGVRLRRNDVQRELCSVMNTAKLMARHGAARNADDSYEFILAVR